jgi:hypothetical protein
MVAAELIPRASFSHQMFDGSAGAGACRRRGFHDLLERGVNGSPCGPDLERYFRRTLIERRSAGSENEESSTIAGKSREGGYSLHCNLFVGHKTNPAPIRSTPHKSTKPSA